MDDHSLVTAEGDIEDDNVVVIVVLTGWDGEIGGRLAPGRCVHLAIAWVLWISDVRTGLIL
jgi:hypothetical protein